MISRGQLGEIIMCGSCTDSHPHFREMEPYFNIWDTPHHNDRGHISA